MGCQSIRVDGKVLSHYDTRGADELDKSTHCIARYGYDVSDILCYGTVIAGHCTARYGYDILRCGSVISGDSILFSSHGAKEIHGMTLCHIKGVKRFIWRELVRIDDPVDEPRPGGESWASRCSQATGGLDLILQVVTFLPIWSFEPPAHSSFLSRWLGNEELISAGKTPWGRIVGTSRKCLLDLNFSEL